MSYVSDFEKIIFWNNCCILIQLDENVKTENLEKCVTYFNTMHTLLLLSSGDTCLHQTKLLLDHTIAFSTACDSIRTDVAIVQALIQVFFFLNKLQFSDLILCSVSEYKYSTNF